MSGSLPRNCFWGKNDPLLKISWYKFATSPRHFQWRGFSHFWPPSAQKPLINKRTEEAATCRGPGSSSVTLAITLWLRWAGVFVTLPWSAGESGDFTTFKCARRSSIKAFRWLTALGWYFGNFPDKKSSDAQSRHDDAILHVQGNVYVFCRIYSTALAVFLGTAGKVVSLCFQAVLRFSRCNMDGRS